MIIHIVRHAEAVERTPQVQEEHRYLTPRGRRRFRKAAKSLATLGIDPDVILTSPLIRAVQTADILAEKLRYKRELVALPQLVGIRPDALEDLLKRYPQAAEVALVGHEPDLGLVTKALLGEGDTLALPKGGTVSFKRASGTPDWLFLQLVTGAGRIVTSRGKAIDRLRQGG